MPIPQVQKRTNLGICLTADEELAVIDTERIEDFYGADGQLTLVHVATDQEFPITMPLVFNPDGIPNNFFDGVRAAAPMPLGTYEIRGKVRNLIGNETVLSRVQIMNGTEVVQVEQFELVSHHIGPHPFPVPRRRRIAPVPRLDGQGPRYFGVPYRGLANGGRAAVGNSDGLLTAKSRVFVPPTLED